MRPRTPTINTSGAGLNVSSPPETPTTGSPTFKRRTGKPTDGWQGVSGESYRSSMLPLGGVGSQFNYARRLRPEQISPRSSDSSDDESEASASPPQSPASDAPDIRASIERITAAHIIVEASFEIEECSEDDLDTMDSDDDDNRLDVLLPYGIEYADSERNRSRSRSEEVDPELMGSMQDLTCFESDQSDFDDDDEDDDFRKHLSQIRQQKRLRRMTSGSISKRTISERGSDSEDREDLQPYDTGAPIQRRLRRRLNRASLLSVPPEIIIELKEPDSDWDAEEINLAQELPFWTMEVDSDSE